MMTSGACLKVNTPRVLWPTMAAHILKELVHSRLWLGLSSEPEAPVTISNNYFGINIAPSMDSRSDDYTVSRLQELNISNVRMDFTYESVGADAERLLQCLLSNQFNVFLNVFPPAEAAKEIDKSKAVAAQWRHFIGSVFANYHQQVAVFEIGNTPNRGRWSGFSHSGFIHAWEIACEEVKPYSIKLAGPNVSDFEPVYNIAFLAVMKRFSKTPEFHTDNLFVERVIEPEAYDHRVLGRWLEKPLSLNLIKKIRVLEDIGKRFDVDKFICTYNCWTTKRLQRKAENPEQKKVDYLLRYLILAAASNSIEQVYWGPLISNRDGLIDCQGEGYPVIDNVSYYKEIIGKVDDFSIKPAYYALQHLVARLSGSVCLQGVSADNGINHFVFEREEQEIHVMWCRDGQSELLRSLYPKDSLSHLSINPAASAKNSDANFYNSVGERLNYFPEVFSEHPLFFIMPADNNNFRPDCESVKSMAVNNSIMMSKEGQQCVPVQLDSWRGAVVLENQEKIAAVVERLLPENIATFPINKVLRDTRNKLWTIDEEQINSGNLNKEKNQLTVKLNRAKGIKKFTYRFVDSKGKRHWDNASTMLRCGIQTPEPVAYFERYNNSGIEENYYICRFVQNAFSARDVFAAFNRGEDSYMDISKGEWFSKLAEFICNMHNQRIIHRDLSSGNLMMASQESGVIDLYMIDIGRAKTGFKERLSPRQRFIDLMRICYKLDWNDRELFIDHYNKQFGAVVSQWWRVPLYFYEYKQTLKKSIKRKLKSLGRKGKS